MSILRPGDIWMDPYGNAQQAEREYHMRMAEMQRAQQNSLTNALGLGATKQQYDQSAKAVVKQDPQPNPVLLLTGDDE